MTYGLWVRHHDVEAHMRLGWLPCLPDRLDSHDFYSVFMMWLCDCPMARPA